MAVNPTSFTPKTKNKISSLIVMIIIAVILGLIAAIGIWQYLNKTQQKVKELTATRAVVVASKEIPAGKKLEESDLAIKQLPAQAVPKDYPNSIDKLKGRIVKDTFKAEEVITQGRLVGEGAAGGLTIVIPPGQRAITIRVNEVVGVGGFIAPGDYVDILSILKIKKSEDQTFSKTILQNVRVIAVGDKIFDPNTYSESQAKVVSQVTFALSPKDTEKLALASETGQLHLVLRPHSEKELVATSGANLEDIYGYITSGSQTANIPIPPSSTNINKNVIEIISGDQRAYYYY